VSSRAALLALVVLAAGVGVAAALEKGNRGATTSLRTKTKDATKPAPRVRPPAAEAGLLPWQLPAPLSREVVLPGTGIRSLMVLGGLEAGGSSTDGVGALDLRTGAFSQRRPLVQATHDATGAELGSRVLVAGGGATAATASTQIERGGRTVAGGALPQARADAGSVTIGATAYLVGGYDGSAMDREVVSTTDGHSYRTVASLPVPVRYPTLAALGSRIYVFGGLGASGHPTAAVQVVDTSRGTARVVGHLPVPVDGASAGVLDGTIYLAGGDRGGSPRAAIYAFEPKGASLLRAGSLRVAVANAGSTVRDGRLWIVGGETRGGRPTGDVQMIVPNRRFGSAGDTGAGSPFFGDRLLVADRGNDRLLLLDDTDKIVWKYPSRGRSAPHGGFYFPDDAFFIRHGTAIISNQEDNDTIVEIAYPSGRIVFHYGHPRIPGSSSGYLHTPDDTYLLRHGNIAVADAANCRVIVLAPRSRRVIHQIGTAGRCVHDPPAALGSPNGDTPLADGNLLISEINGSWVDEVTPSGRVVWDTHLAIGYPSDPQQIGPDRYLIADYENPGAVVEFDRRGRIDFRYQPANGPGALDHPSLVELLPSGAFMINDDYNDRMVAIDPSTRALVWQYGVTGHAGTATGRLNTPDGFDLLAPRGRTPTHPTTG
jgi:outer membrane protein assembly factor BamB